MPPITALARPLAIFALLTLALGVVGILFTSALAFAADIAVNGGNLTSAAAAAGSAAAPPPGFLLGIYQSLDPFWQDVLLWCAAAVVVSSGLSWILDGMVDNLKEAKHPIPLWLTLAQGASHGLGLNWRKVYKIYGVWRALRDGKPLPEDPKPAPAAPTLDAPASSSPSVFVEEPTKRPPPAA